MIINKSPLLNLRFIRFDKSSCAITKNTPNVETIMPISCIKVIFSLFIKPFNIIINIGTNELINSELVAVVESKPKYNKVLKSVTPNIESSKSIKKCLCNAFKIGFRLTYIYGNNTMATPPHLKSANCNASISSCTNRPNIKLPDQNIKAKIIRIYVFIGSYFRCIDAVYLK